MKFIFIVLFILSAFNISSQNFSNDFQIKHIPLSNKLSDANVKRIVQDKQGFIWIATETGISRYDGKNIKPVSLIDSDGNRLVNNKIQCLACDSKGRIWAGTLSGVINIDNHCNLIDILKDNPIQRFKITALLSDEKYMWIGTDKGLYRYDLDKNEFIGIYNNPNNENTLSGGSITSILKTKDNKIWIGLWGSGINIYDPEKGSIEKMPKIGNLNIVTNLYEDQDGDIWVSTWRDNMLKIENNSQLNSFNYKYYDITKSLPENKKTSIVYNIIEDENNKLWILSSNGILRMNDKNSEELEFIDISKYNSNSSNFLHYIFKDKENDIWIGAESDGLYCISFNEQIFNYEPIKELKKSLGFVFLNDLYAKDSLLWCSLVNGGVCVLNINDKFDMLYHKSLDNTTIYKIFTSEDNDICGIGDLIIGFKNGLYNNIDNNPKLRGRNITSYIRGHNVKDLLFDKKDRIWFAGYRGTYMVDKYNKCHHIAPDFKEATQILLYNDSCYWIASTNSGILKVIENNNKFEIINYSEKLKAKGVNTLYLDSKLNLWVGTDNGLFVYNDDTDAFENKNRELGLLESFISNIIEDKDGYLWLTSINKIIKIDLINKSSMIYSQEDNIKVSSFRSNSSTIIGDSLIVFGGNEGFCFFKPVKNKIQNESKTIIISDLKIFNKSIFDNNNSFGDIYRNDSLYLSYKQNSLSIEFSSLDFSHGANEKYAYKLHGIDPDWVYVDGNRSFTNYNSLEPGKYVFEVKASSYNGGWSNQSYKLNILIYPSPFLSPVAYSIYMFVVIVITFMILYFIYNRIKLKNRLTISEIEKKHSEELIQTKLRYFTNISHELMTPLTIISCMVDEIGLKNPEIQLDYLTIKSNVNRLKRLLQQVLDFRKVESENMSLTVGYGDFKKAIIEICKLNFQPLTNELQINLDVICEEDEIKGWFDYDKIDKIIFNILSNAFKYTPKGGEIEVLIKSKNNNNLSYVNISIKDTGCGIPTSFLPYIFDRFSSNSYNKKVESNGIGLALVKDLIKLHKGTVEVESEENKGTTFIIELPIDELCYINESINVSKINNPVIENEDIKYLDNIVDINNKETILIVDDNQDLLNSLTRFFSTNYTVFTASNGLEALDKLKDKNISLIISDIMMPIMDGLEFCSRIKTNIETSHIPVILLTAKNKIEDRIDCYNVNADAYISKPFDLSLLEVRVKNLISNKSLKKQQYKKQVNINIEELEFTSIDNEFLEKAIKIVEDNIDDFDFTPDNLISEMNTTRSSMYRKLKSLTGLSSSEFIKNIRLKRACNMLEKDAGNISDIAYRTGFSDPKYFSTCFKNEFGMSPREYIKSLKNQ